MASLALQILSSRDTVSSSTSTSVQSTAGAGRPLQPAVVNNPEPRATMAPQIPCHSDEMSAKVDAAAVNPLSPTAVVGGCQKLLQSPANDKVVFPVPNSNQQQNRIVAAPPQQQQQQLNHQYHQRQPQQQQPTQSIYKPLPILYVGIIMERPPNLPPTSPFSWGFSITKEKSKHAFIVGINPTVNQPVITYAQISNVAPNPAIVYNTTSGTTQQYPKRSNKDHELLFRNNFPKAWNGCSASTAPSMTSSAPSLSSQSLQPGDAIVSINGVAVSGFESTTLIANYIRQNCQQRIQIVALRHSTVWKAAWGQISNPVRKMFPSITQAKNEEQKQQQKLLQEKMRGALEEEQRKRVSRMIKEGWGYVQLMLSHQSGGGGQAAVKRKQQQTKKRKIDATQYQLVDNRPLVNLAFKDETGQHILYSDNDFCDPDDGKRLSQFVTDDIKVSFDQWLIQRKSTWKENRKGRSPGHLSMFDDEEETMVQHDFWIASGFKSFEEWLLASKAKWRRSYSWHKDRRIKLQTESEKEVHFPLAADVASSANKQEVLDQFQSWLGVRKQQWRIERRKRQRLRTDSFGADASLTSQETASLGSDGNDALKERCATTTDPNGTGKILRRKMAATTDNMIIDEIVDDQLNQERRVSKEELDNRPPMDISWLFDSTLGAPDDVIVVIMRFLNPSDHGNLLCLNWTSNYSFKKRDEMWQTLCPQHWVLPRRPRKSWCLMYITKIRLEEENARKRSDGVLLKANIIIEKGDFLDKLKKVVAKAEKDGFTVNYTSGVVIERNSLLNMACISGRTKIAKWLIDEKGADIESFDRGAFTPLLNCAWNGDKHLVRYLLGKGSDRRKVGRYHSSQGIAPLTFDGLDAEGWARKRGHEEVANLIKYGL